jgi:uncharacterized membrane protein (UPF0127 family)
MCERGIVPRMRTSEHERDKIQGMALVEDLSSGGDRQHLREPLSSGWSLMSGPCCCFRWTHPGHRQRVLRGTRPRALISMLFLFLIIGGFSAAGDKAFCESGITGKGDGELQFLRQDGSIAVSISIEIADTAEARIKGLMERWALPELHGMLFIFDSPDVQRFWMHNTPLSLDMVFVDENRRILNMAESTTPMSKQTYSSRGPAKYVVEVRAGFSKRHGIEEGMSIQWQARPKVRK